MRNLTSTLNVSVCVKTAALLLLAASAAFPAGRMNRYALILEDAPLAARVQTRKDLPRMAATDRLAAKHDSLKAALAGRGIRVTAADQVLTNAIFVQAPDEAEDSLRGLPGVAYVEKLRPMKLHLGRALELSNVSAAWSQVNGPQNAGAGVRIAIIDSGIDQTHPAFDDSGMQVPSGFPKCQPGDCAYTNRKVIVARSYVNMLVGSDPATSRPDDLSPRDRVGHGTAVAMVAAGRRNSGPAGEIQGVAPAAFLGNYKVFGSPGVNGRYTYDDVIIQAMNDAVADGMNIAVLSLGSPAFWGPRDRGSTCGFEGTRACDWRAEAAEYASRLGLTLVVSAGNDGDMATRWPAFNSVETPGAAPSAITVGATTNAHIFYQSLTVSGPNVPANVQRQNTMFGNGPLPGSPITAELRDVAQLGNDGKACEPLGNGSLNGAIALILRGDCQLPLKVQNAQRAGAVAAIIYQAEGTQGVFPMRGLEETGIPAVILGNRDATLLRDYVNANPTARVTLDPALTSVQTTEYDEVAVFSSRGPSIREHGIKPELVAVGTDLYTATQRFDPNGDLYNPTGYAAVQGTSFAAPLVAGTVALVKQRNPGFTAAQLKSAVVNTANPQVKDYDGDRLINATIFDMGAGKLDAGNAVRTNVTIEPATVSFGPIGNTLPNAQGLKICNHGTGNLSLRLAVVPTPGVSSSIRVQLNRTNFSLGAGACVDDVTVRLEGSRPSPGVYEGAVQIDGGAVSLRVPWVYVVPDGVPYSILMLEGDGFEGEPDVRVPLTFKVLDRFGMPVAGQQVRFQVTRGGGSIEEEGKETDDLGIGWADVVVGKELGEQEYYVAVGGNQDFGMYFAGRSRLAPAISNAGVVNAASGQAGRGFAPGSYISIFGRGLSEVTRVFSTPYLPLSLAGVSVSFDVQSQNLHVPGRIHFVSDGQVNVQVPWELQGVSSAQMKVSIGDASSTVVNVPIASHSPAMFEYNDTGGRMLAAAVGEAGVIGSGNTAKRGAIVSLYVNGLGAVDNQPASGDAAPTDRFASTRTSPQVTVGSRPAEVLFSGLAPGFVGLYQVNVRIPSDAPTGIQPVVITADGIASKNANLPIE